jgi:N6-L-threonylcarbamoyladenine synthase
MITLGIETSCDETALSLIETRTLNGALECRIIASLINSQADLHSAYGGVFPSLAKREHGKNLLPLLKKLLIEGGYIAGAPSKNYSTIIEKFRVDFAEQNPDLVESFKECDFLKTIPPIDRITVTEGPGLEPALWVGITFAKVISEIWSIPLIPVNHMEGHIVGSLLESDKADGTWNKLKPLHFPALALLVSGGHTELVEIKSNVKSSYDSKLENENVEARPAADNKSRNDDFCTANISLLYSILGQTKDDAVGEAFDKVARLLGLPYPGGLHVSNLAALAVAEKIVSEVKLPRPMLHSGDLNFSFSGLKTAVLYATKDEEKKNGKLSDHWKKGLAREFEEAVKESLDTKFRKAIDATGAKTIIIGGGVSANKTLRSAFEKTASEYGIPLYLPQSQVSGDNALMIALAGALDSRIHSSNLKAQGTMRLA